MRSKHFAKFLHILVAAGLIFLSLTEIHAQKYTGSPVTKSRLIKGIQSRQFAVPIIVKQIKLGGVDFEVTPSVERELLAVRANQQIIDAARDNYRYRGQATTGPKRPPPAPERDIAGENYERLFYQGVETLNQLRTATSVAQARNISTAAIATANQAIKANPARPEAYTLVGSAYLFMRNFAEAERYGQLAVDRGGNLSFPVWHLAGTPHVEILFIGQGFVTIESNQEFFQFNSREVSNPRAENDYYLNGVRVAVFSITTTKNGRTDKWFFTPGNTGTPQEATMIMDLIKKNSMGGR